MGISHDKKRVLLFTMTILIVLIISVIAYNLWSIFHTSAKAENQTEIDIYNCFGSYSSKNIALSDIIENYSENNPNVRITNTSMPTEKFYTKLLADFSANCGADIIIAPPSYDILQLYKRGFIASLDDEFKKDSEWAESFDGSILRFVTDDEAVYGLPADVEYILLFYNAEIFQRYGLEPPKSYEDFKKVVSALAKTDTVPIAFSPNDPNLYLYQILTSMLKNYDYSSESGELGTEYITAMDYMKELYALGAFPKNYENLNTGETNNLFLNGSAAMIVTTNSFVNDISQYATAEGGDYTKYINQFGIIAFPSESSPNQSSNVVFSTVAYNAGDFTIFINKNAYEKKYDEIMKYIKYLTSPEALRIYLAQTNDIISVKNIENKEYKNRLVTNCKIAVGNATKFTSMPIDTTYRYIWKTQVCDNVPNIYNGTIGFDEISERINTLSTFND